MNRVPWAPLGLGLVRMHSYYEDVSEFVGMWMLSDDEDVEEEL